MYPVSSNFHTLATADSPQTRVRIYFIDDSVDCTDDNDVQTNGTLLVRNVGDTNSNRMISGDNGIVFSDLFNTDTNLVFGTTVSKTVQIALLNFDGALDGFTFGRCKIYLDLYDATNTTWLSCPMGVYLIERPTKLNTKVVNASGYDQMQKLDKVADVWWTNIDWSNGVTVSDLITDIATNCGVSVSANLSSNILNGTNSYTEAPLTANQTTYRDILGWLGGITGTIAYFDRDGALDMKWFTYAMNGLNVVTVDSDASGSGVFSIDLAEYAVGPIDMLDVLPYDASLSVSVGDGDNKYELVGNPFLIGADAAAVETLATPIYNRLKTVVLHRPMTINLITDWSLEAGDVIKVIINTIEMVLPIMQQTLTWRGGFVIAEMMCSGDAERPVPDYEERSQYQNAVSMHEFENTANQLRSLIHDLNGNYTLIQQTVNSIEQTVSAQGVSISNILDPSGEIWTAITENSSNLTDIESALNSEITTRQSYIRFIPAEPAIVLGVDTGNEIKLKLVNNVIYFFDGADDSTDLSLAYAYFNSQEAGADRFVATESIQVGNENTTYRWKWHMIANGDFVLDLV